MNQIQECDNMKIYELLATPDKWTKGAYARDKDGKPVLHNFNNATCYCLKGATYKCYDGLEWLKTFKLLEQAIGSDFVSWNDAPERTHAEVLELCKKLDI